MLFLSGPTIKERMAEAGNRPSGFDYLRLLLSTLVIVSHAVGVSYGVAQTISVFGGELRPFVAIILPMFFALSGFLVAGSLTRCKSLISFLGLRIIRLIPALAVETLLAAVLIGFIFTNLSAGEYFSSSGFYRYFLNILGIVQFYLPGVFSQLPWPHLVNGQLWTLPWELYCYAAIAVLSLVGLVRGDRRFIIAVVILHIVLFVVYVVIKRQAPGVTVSGPVLILCFLYGIGLYLFRDRIVWSPGLFALSLVATLACLSFGIGDYLVALPCAYVTVFLGLTTPKRRWIVSSGDYSYGLFLYGFPIQQAVAATVGPEGHTWWANAAISWSQAFCLAFFSWHVIEKNALKLRPYLFRAEDKMLAFLYSESIRKIIQSRKIAFTVLALAILGSAIGSYFIFRKKGENFPLLARLSVINGHIEEADPDFIFVVGDSNAEMINPTHRICDQDVVNAGISGAKMADMNSHWGQFEFTNKPSGIIILIGTNDLHRKRKPTQPKYLTEFEKNAERLVQSASRLGAQVFVAAVPPAEPRMNKYYDPAAVVALSERLKLACERNGCKYIDPFAKTRNGPDGLALEGTTRDGIHVKSYRDAIGAVETAICNNPKPPST